MLRKKLKSVQISKNKTRNYSDDNFSSDSNIFNMHRLFNKHLTGNTSHNHNKDLSVNQKLKSLFSKKRRTANSRVDHNESSESILFDIHNNDSMKTSELLNLNHFPIHRLESSSSQFSISSCSGQKSEQNNSTLITNLLTNSETDSENENLKKQMNSHTFKYTYAHGNDTQKGYTTISESSGFTVKHDEGERFSLSQLPFTVPDPTAFRDLDNASPNTVALCRQHLCHYCFYVYFPSSMVDNGLKPFRRKDSVDTFSRSQNLQYIQDNKQTNYTQDTFTDRRIQSIEKQSGTQIHLSQHHSSITCIKGLPCRRVTIAGPTFINICYA
ncbi:peptidyl-tRNA hydrolase PTRHD1 [Schistosoma japonicum]|nr:peptidyl-tRNA hydrolase PTRHD1 [Schistosoma japonicum]